MISCTAAQSEPPSINCIRRPSSASDCKCSAKLFGASIVSAGDRLTASSKYSMQCFVSWLRAYRSRWPVSTAPITFRNAVLRARFCTSCLERTIDCICSLFIPLRYSQAAASVTNVSSVTSPCPHRSLAARTSSLISGITNIRIV